MAGRSASEPFVVLRALVLALRSCAGSVYRSVYRCCCDSRSALASTRALRPLSQPVVRSNRRAPAVVQPVQISYMIASLFTLLAVFLSVREISKHLMNYRQVTSAIGRCNACHASDRTTRRCHLSAPSAPSTPS
jgi:hypothetical protein